jgi:hypothetical protein
MIIDGGTITGTHAEIMDFGYAHDVGWLDDDPPIAVPRALSAPEGLLTIRDIHWNSAGSDYVNDLVWPVRLDLTRPDPGIAASSSDPAKCRCDDFHNWRWMANGAVTLTIRTAAQTLNRSVTMTSGTATITEFKSFVEGSLAAEIAETVDNWLANTSAEAGMFSEIEGTSYTRNATLWCGMDLSCVSVWNSESAQYAMMTAISDNIVIGAWHFLGGRANGYTVRFVSAGNVVVERTITAQARVGATDIWLGKLDSALPASIIPAKVLPASHPQLPAPATAIFTTAGIYPLPAVRINQFFEAVAVDWFYENVLPDAPFAAAVANSITFHAPVAARRLEFYTPVINLDSSGPVLSPFGADTVLLMCITGGNYGGGYGPSVSLNLSVINTAIAGLSGHAPAAVDPGGYPSF